MKKKEQSPTISDVIGVLLCIALFAVIARADLRILIPVSFAVPALLASLTGMFYNRARSWPNGPTQRRSLFAAEILLRSLLLSLICVLSGVALTFFISFFLKVETFSTKQVLDVKNFDEWLLNIHWSIWFYLVPCFIFLGAYSAFVQGTRIAIRKRFYIGGRRTLKSLFKTMNEQSVSKKTRQ